MPQHESNAVPSREMLEPCALRGASTVLRGGRCSDIPSLPDPQGGYERIGNRLHLSKIGAIKIKVHRECTGRIKTCTVKRDGDHWYAIFPMEPPQRVA
jgi:hypothetical protein